MTEARNGVRTVSVNMICSHPSSYRVSRVLTGECFMAQASQATPSLGLVHGQCLSCLICDLPARSKHVHQMCCIFLRF